MADEAIPIETPTRFRRITVADGTAIPLHTILKLSDPFTGAASSADGDKPAGIAWEEKTANDGITEIVVALDGVWDLKDSGSGITVGIPFTIGGANTIKAAAAGEAETGDIMGIPLETATASETIRCAVNIS